MEVTQELSDRVHRLARKAINDDLYEDAAQEVLIKLWKHAEYALDGMVTMMVKYWYVRLSKDNFSHENIYDHSDLIYYDDQPLDTNVLVLIKDSNMLTQTERTVISLVLDGIPLYLALEMLNVNKEGHIRFLEKCRKVIDIKKLDM